MFFPPCSLCVVNFTAIPFLFWATLQNPHLSYAQRHLSQASQCWFLWRTTCKHVMHRLCTHKPSLCRANHLCKWHMRNYPHYTMEYLEGISSALAHTVIVWIHQTLVWNGDIFLSKFTLNQWQSPISLRTLVTSFVACIFMSLDRLVKVWLVLIIKDLATK